MYAIFPCARKSHGMEASQPPRAAIGNFPVPDSGPLRSSPSATQREPPRTTDSLFFYHKDLGCIMLGMAIFVRL